MTVFRCLTSSSDRDFDDSLTLLSCLEFFSVFTFLSSWDEMALASLLKRDNKGMVKKHLLGAPKGRSEI